jgi:soluble lytic murein transglycosylase-like protein
MQLMPATARFVAQKNYVPDGDPSQLSTPEVNMALGQKYIEMLLSDSAVGTDLFRLAVAWNGGPGNLGKWDRQTGFADDPLLFIETIPARETRIFIERVLANLWTYRDRLGQPVASLDSLAGGAWPGYDGFGIGLPVEIAEQHDQR